MHGTLLGARLRFFLFFHAGGSVSGRRCDGSYRQAAHSSDRAELPTLYDNTSAVCWSRIANDGDSTPAASR